MSKKRFGCLALALLLALLALRACFSPRPPIPTDEEMIAHFYAHREAFEQIRAIIEQLPYGPCYPPFDGARDERGCLRGVSPAHRKALDRLLREVGCKRVFYWGKELRKEEHARSVAEIGSCARELDTVSVRFSFHYYATGWSIGGTSKDYFYASKLHPGEEQGLVSSIDSLWQLNLGADMVLTRRIEGNWYIDFMHDN